MKGLRRRATSRRQRQLSFADGGGGVLKRDEDIVTFDVGVIRENVINRPTGSKLADDRANSDTHPADARQATHLSGIDGNPIRCHGSILRPHALGVRADSRAWFVSASYPFLRTDLVLCSSRTVQLSPCCAVARRSDALTFAELFNFKLFSAPPRHFGRRVTSPEVP